MRRSSLSILISGIIILTICISGACFALGIKYKTTGIYTDTSGRQQVWSITDNHTLIWDGEPYIPVGGVFTSKYLSLDATEENYQADVQALEIVKSKGVTDIILRSTKPITSVETVDLQKIINYLDSNGFTYGLEMNDGPKQPLSGYLISPNRYRLEGPVSDTTIVCDVPDVDSAIYVVVSKIDNTISATGGAFVLDGKLTINLSEPLTSNKVLLVYPHKSFKTVEQGGEGDIWSGFGEYRDRVLAYFKNVKLGSGFRFFLEPFTSKMDFMDDMIGFIPDTPGFRLGLEAYLTRRHVHEGAVCAAWGFTDNLDKIETAARLAPLWYSGRGVPYFFDQSGSKLVNVDISVTGAWRDIIDYRDVSAQEYMNAIADALKKQVANVPVIFKNNRYHRIYANPFGMSGFDGLGAVAYGTAEQPVAHVAGPAYSLAEESAKTTWFIIAATQTSADKKTLVGYSGESVMTGTLDLFREVGAKGFFIDSLQALPEETRSNFSLLKDSQQIEWLANFKTRLKTTNAANFKPEVISFPVNPSTGAVVKRLAPNTWWLPTLRVGRTSFIGDGLSAYTIVADDKTCIWSMTGQTTVTLNNGSMNMPTVVFPDGSSLIKKKDSSFSMGLTDVPTVLKGMDFSRIFPFETASLEISKLKARIPEADRLGIDVSSARSSLERAETVLANGQAMIAYGIAQTGLQELMNAMGADMWIEGETSPAHNFDRVMNLTGASGGMVLMMHTDSDPPLMPYIASYVFNAPSNASYEIWVAGTPLSESSTLSYCIDDAAWITLSAAETNAGSYASGLSWYKIGAINIFPGKHILKFKVDGRRPQDNRYFFALDAIVLSPHGFKPNGVQKPY